MRILQSLLLGFSQAENVNANSSKPNVIIEKLFALIRRPLPDFARNIVDARKECPTPERTTAY